MAIPFDKLTSNDLTLIENYIKDYVVDAEYDANLHCEFAGVENILAPWNHAKPTLFKLFGEELILSKEFSFAMTREELYRQVTDLLYSNPFMLKMREAYYNGVFDRTWLDTNGSWKMKEVVSSLVNNSDTFIDNKFWYWPEEYKKITLKVGKEGTDSIDLFPSTKVMKVLGKVADMLGIEGFEEFRIAHSQVLNQKSLKGDFSISIHPLDYMTMSDNECGWESCMSWRNFGGYRQGTVEMMNSPCVIVAYMKSKTPLPIWGGEWNNKKWRCLFIVDENIICKVKSYPYQNDQFERDVINWIRELAEKNLGVEYEEDIISWDGEGSVYYNDKRYEPDFCTGHMYNDFGTCIHLMTFVKGFDNEHSYIGINYSGESECVWCGAITGMDDDGDLACSDCMTKCYCIECRDRIYSNDIHEDDHGYTYCSHCFENYTVVDPVTGLRGQRGAHTPVYVIPSNQKFIGQYREAVYNSCRDLSQVINRLHRNCNEDVIAYLYDTDTEIDNFVDSSDKLHCMEWKPNYWSWADYKTYYVFIEDLVDKDLKEEYSALWGLDEDDYEEVLETFKEDFHHIVETSIRVGYDHLIPGHKPPKTIHYDNSEWTTTSSSTGYAFKVMKVDENPEVVLVDIPIKTEEENDNDEFPF